METFTLITKNDGISCVFQWRGGVGLQCTDDDDGGKESILCLTPEEARKLSDALIKFADHVDNESAEEAKAFFFAYNQACSDIKKGIVRDAKEAYDKWRVQK